MKTTVLRAARCAGGVLLAFSPLLFAANGGSVWVCTDPVENMVYVTPGGAYLGVGVQEVDVERAKKLKLKDDYGVEITHVQADSPAAKAGLKVGDVVVEFNGQRVEGMEQFIRLVRETPAGRTVKLQVQRDGHRSMITPTLVARRAPVFGSVPSEGLRFEVPRVEMMMPDIPKSMMSWRSTTLGVEAEALGSSQLAAYFGVKEGVLVRSVGTGTVADRAGLKAGDVLVKVDDVRVSALRDVTAAILNARSGGRSSFPVTVVRDKKEVGLTVTFEDNSDDSAPGHGRKISLK